MGRDYCHDKNSFTLITKISSDDVCDKHSRDNCHEIIKTIFKENVKRIKMYAISAVMTIVVKF